MIKTKTTYPKVVVFACNWCGYSAFDAAGTGRIPYPAEIRPVVTMCSGRVQPGLILKAFELGADGVVVAGCENGTCHYAGGNQQGQNQVELTKKLLDILGFNPKRLTFIETSAGDGQTVINKLTEFIKRMQA